MRGFVAFRVEGGQNVGLRLQGVQIQVSVLNLIKI